VKYSRDFLFFTEEETKQILSILLSFLKENDSFVQDISCLGICHIYNASISDSFCNRESVRFSFASYIAREVTAVLSRDKKVDLPAGCNSATRSFLKIIYS
jgi:hypothetical protein